MFKPFKIIFSLILGGFIISSTAHAADTDPMTDVLKQTDAVVCSTPKKLLDHYSSKIVIISDDHRIMPNARIKDFENMVSELRGLKCTFTRKVLSSQVGSQAAFMLIDETVSVKSESGHIDDRQHSVCTYGFVKEGGAWKIGQEHCSSLPDYTIDPEDDALYYFHNPLY